MSRRSRLACLLIAGLPLTLFQSCLIFVDGQPSLFLDLRESFPHFDGDGEDSFLDRLFGFDDDD